MINKPLLTLLKRLNACMEAIEWIEKDKLSLKQAWFECKRADWLIWFAVKVKMVTHQEIVLVACACAETALKYVPKGEDRPRQAIEVARKWALNPTEKNRNAAHAADAAAHAAAYAVAYAAHAAHAADAACGGVCAAHAAADAAYAAADAAYAAAYAAHAAACAAAQEKLCKIVRKMIKFKDLK